MARRRRPYLGAEVRKGGKAFRQLGARCLRSGRCHVPLSHCEKNVSGNVSAPKLRVRRGAGATACLAASSIAHNKPCDFHMM
ncbi:Protein of unknown function [Gryllus bimaculatus]|nr:Protein of unknown function [Gryllus bimaculatus]